jgi:hypothetical protein
MLYSCAIFILAVVSYTQFALLCRYMLVGILSDIVSIWLETGMVSFMHIAKNVKVTELSLYEDAILDSCCRNIPADDELWYHIVEVLVLLLTFAPKEVLVIIVRFYSCWI